MKTWYAIVFFSLLCIISSSKQKVSADEALNFNNLTINSTTLPIEQLSALFHIYHQLNGSYWDWSALIQGTEVHWNFSQINIDPCGSKWAGITCICPSQNFSSNQVLISSPRDYSILNVYYDNLGDNEYFPLDEFSDLALPKCEIIGLELSYGNLTGNLPNIFDNLASLTVLRMTNNSLMGTLPSSIYSLNKLRYLSLRSNELSGSLSNDLIVNLLSIETIRLQYNYLTGLLPENIWLLSNLTYLHVGHNQFSHHLPEINNTAHNISSMKYLYLAHNFFSGSLPVTWSDGLPELHSLTLHFNNLIGPLWDDMSGFQSLKIIYLQDNSLTGIIPDTFYSLTNIFLVNLDNNQISGSISEDIDNLFQLSLFSLSSNDLTGSIPSSITELDSLLALYLNGNMLTGTLPVQIIGESLIGINLADNFLTGSIPHGLGYSSQLSSFILSSNELTGSLPHSLCQLTGIGIIKLDNNKLTGSIPSCIGSMASLSSFLIQMNVLTGTLPRSLGDLDLYLLNIQSNRIHGNFHDLTQLFGQWLVYLDIGRNHFTGSFPSNFWSSFHNLVLLNVDSNTLTGTIPSFDLYYSFAYLSFSNNHFHGTIPKISCCYNESYVSNQHYILTYRNYFTGSLPEINYNSDKYITFIGFHNYFTGSIPNYNLTFQSLLLSNNHLEGTIPELSYSNSTLMTLDLSSNYLTGTLPSKIFSYSKLFTLILSSNCFHGMLSSDICHGHQLNQLALNGLQGRCKYSILSTTKNFNQLRGEIPSCIYQMNNLTLLQLSGNLFTGTLSEGINFPSNLLNLSLSYNVLRGTIPEDIQHRYWQMLDLSFNKLSGQLYQPNQQSASSSIHYLVNRLSGPIPSLYSNISDVSILSGNLFGCDYHGDQLPPNDPDQNNYNCGSNTLNATLYAWGGWMFVILLAVFIIICLYGYIPPSSPDDLPQDSWYSRYIFLKLYIIQALQITGEVMFSMFDHSIVTPKELLPSFTSKTNYVKSHYHRRLYRIAHFVSFLTKLRVLFQHLGLYIFIILIPSFLFISKYYKNVSHSYAWLVSPAYLSGRVSFFYLFLLLLISTFIFYRDFDSIFRQNKIFKGFRNDLRRYCSIIPFVLFNKASFLTFLFIYGNIIIVGFINVFYVYISMIYSWQIAILAQIAMAIFKILWNSILLPFLLTWITMFTERSTDELHDIFEKQTMAIQKAMNEFKSTCNDQQTEYQLAAQKSMRLMFQQQQSSSISWSWSRSISVLSASALGSISTPTTPPPLPTSPSITLSNTQIPMNDIDTPKVDDPLQTSVDNQDIVIDSHMDPQIDPIYYSMSHDHLDEKDNDSENSLEDPDKLDQKELTLKQQEEEELSDIEDRLLSRSQDITMDFENHHNNQLPSIELTSVPSQSISRANSVSFQPPTLSTIPQTPPLQRITSQRSQRSHLSHVSNRSVLLQQQHAQYQSSTKFKASKLMSGVFLETLLNILNTLIIPSIAVVMTDPNCLLYYIRPPNSIETKYLIPFPDIFDVFVVGNNIHFSYYNFESSSSYVPSVSYSYQCSAALVSNYTSVFFFMYFILNFVHPILKPLFGWLTSYYSAKGSNIYQDYLIDHTSALLQFKGKSFVINCINHFTILLTFGALFPPLGVIIALTQARYLTSLILGFQELINRIRNHHHLGIDQEDEICLTCSEELKEITIQLIKVESTLKYMLRHLIPICNLFFAFFLFDTLGDVVGYLRAYWVLLVCVIVVFCFDKLYQRLAREWTFRAGKFFEGFNARNGVDNSPVDNNPPVDSQGSPPSPMTTLSSPQKSRKLTISHFEPPKGRDRNETIVELHDEVLEEKEEKEDLFSLKESRNVVEDFVENIYSHFI